MEISLQMIAFYQYYFPILSNKQRLQTSWYGMVTSLPWCSSTTPHLGNSHCLAKLRCQQTLLPPITREHRQQRSPTWAHWMISAPDDNPKRLLRKPVKTGITFFSNLPIQSLCKAQTPAEVLFFFLETGLWWN